MKYRIQGYKPGPDSLRFHKLIENDPRAKEILVLAPIRSGKSYSIKQQIIRDAWLNPHGVDAPLLVTAPTYGMVRPIHERPLKAFFHRAGLLKSHNFQTHEMELVNGNWLHFRSMEDPDNIRGSGYYRAYCDEAAYCKEYAIDVVRGRLLTTDGNLVMITTPKGTANWIYQKYFTDEGIEERGTDFRLIKYKLSNNPLITPAAEQRLRQKYDTKLAAQELDAEFIDLFQDLVYYSFSEANIKAGLFEDWRQNKSPIYIGLDYNVGIMAYVAVTKLDSNVFAVIDEGSGFLSVEDVGKNILMKYGSDVTIIDDASGRNRNQTDGRTNRDLLYQLGFRKIMSNKKNPLVMRRVSNLNAHFRDSLGNLRVYIDPRCRKLISETRTITYKEGKAIIDDMGNKRGHHTDALGYCIGTLSAYSFGWDSQDPGSKWRQDYAKRNWRDAA